MKLIKSKDANGNSILKLTSKFGGFSTQINGNIDISILEDFGNITNIDKKQACFNSLCQFIKKYGNERQKRIMQQNADMLNTTF